MPARRKARSETGKPAGSMICASIPRQAQSRRIVPQFCGISGWKRAMRRGTGFQLLAGDWARWDIQPNDLCKAALSWPEWTGAIPARVPIEPAGLRCPLPVSWTGCSRSIRHPPGLPVALPDGSQRGWAHRQPRRAVIVTTMSSAEPTRRDFLYLATGAVGAVGAVAAAIPLIAQMNPDASTIA